MKRRSAAQTMAIAAAAIISPSKALEKYSALVWPNGWSSSAGRAAIVTIASAKSADARLTNDSIASERRPTEPVTHHAAVFRTMATTAVATERRSSVVTCIGPRLSAG